MEIDISIIVPTCNRAEKLNNCLKSLFDQDYPMERLEIIVVDDRANDSVMRMMEDLQRWYPQIKYTRQRCKGPANARNVGVRLSTGKVIAFTDDDCVVDKDWTRLMVETHRSHPEAFVVGGDTVTSTRGPFVLTGQFLSTCSIETGVNGKKEIVFFPTCNVSFKRHIFERYAFDEQFPLPGGEDLEFFWRLFKAGHRFIWNKKIKVTHYRDDTVISFIKQAYTYGKGNFLVQYLHGDHPLLKELKTGRIDFWAATLINAIKIPRFSYLLGKKLFREEHIRDVCKKIAVYLYLALHKIVYIWGNIFEFFRITGKHSLNKKRKVFNVPQLLILDITHTCNLSCSICDIWKTAKAEKEIDIKYVRRLLYQARELGVKEVALSGGEPLARRDIFKILDCARDLNIKNLGVLSNGILLEKYINRLRPYLLDRTISPVVSLDSLNPVTHNSVRKSSICWDGSINSLKALSVLKKEHPHISFNVIAIILNQNLEELHDLALFVESLGADSLQFQALLSNNLMMSERSESVFWVTKERFDILDSAIDCLIGFKEKNQSFIKNSIENLELIKKYFRGKIGHGDIRCMSGDKTVLVSNSGECTTCFSSYGNIKKKTLCEIFQSREAVSAREKVKKCPCPCLLPCFCDL